MLVQMEPNPPRQRERVFAFMPSAAPRPCGHPGCHDLGTNGYCIEHQADVGAGKFADPRRGSRQSRGYGAAHDARRKRILRRDKGLCQVHGAHCKYRATAVDHIVSKAEGKARGWSDEQIEADANQQAICVECHKEKTQAEAQQARGRGGSIPCSPTK